MDDYGAPRYPELVLAVTRETLDERADLVDACSPRCGRARAEALARPRRAPWKSSCAASGADEPLVRAQLEAVAPALRPPMRLDREALEGWARFDARFGILSGRPTWSGRSRLP